MWEVNHENVIQRVGANMIWQVAHTVLFMAMVLQLYVAVGWQCPLPARYQKTIEIPIVPRTRGFLVPLLATTKLGI